METLGLNVTDLVILFVVGSSGIISLFRGFTKELLSLLLWIFAFFAAVLRLAVSAQLVQQKAHIFTLVFLCLLGTSDKSL